MRAGASSSSTPSQERPAATILVIDDERIVRDITKAILESGGYAVHLAGSGTEGIDAFRRHGDEIDLVLVDMLMPGLDGRATCAEIDRIGGGARLVLSSGTGDDDKTVRLDSGREIPFVHKPYSRARLLEVVSAELARGGTT